MANYQLLKADIDAKVYQNAQQEITGENLNAVLNAMVTTLGAGYQFAGVATTATNPGTPDAKVFYIANGKGTYTNFGGIEVTEDEVVVLYWDTAWHKEATGIASNEKLTELGQKIDSNIEVDGTIDDGTINVTGLIVIDSSTNRNLYFISCQGLAKVIVSDGDVYGFFTAPPAVGSVTSDGIRHLDTLSNTEITIPDGVTYLAVRAATQPTFKLPEDGLKQRTATLEEKTATLEEKTAALDIQVNGEKNGYPGYALLSTIASPTDSYYISEKPASGLVASVNVKVGYPSGRTLQILRVTAPQLGGAITYDVIASHIIQQGQENSVVNIPLNIQLADDEYIGIKGTSQDCWYFGQAQGYRLYRDGGYADNYTAAIQIIGAGLEQRVSTLEDLSPQVKRVASDIAMFENIGFCGDSYTAGMIVVSENPTVTAENQNLCWGKIIERTHGVNSFIYALGGTSVVDNKPTNSWYLDNSVCLPKLLSESAKNLYVISLGHNDAYISTYTTKTKTEFLNEFETNYRSIISQVSAHAPNAKIILCKQSGPYMQMGWGADINDKIVAIGQDLGIPVLLPEDDAYLSSDIYVNTMVHNHPVFAGYAGIAKAFDRLFCKATVDYWDYFKGYTGL